jgi:hypothetical protein
MEWSDLGGGLIGAGLAGIGSNISDALRQRQALQQMQELGQQIQSGDLLGAANTAISKGNLDVGLKLYQLHHQYSDEAGLGEKLTGILGGAPAAPAAAPINIKPQASLTAAPGDVMVYAPGITKAEGTGGDYSSLGKIVTNGGMYDGDRAYGRYQVMGRNIPSWTKEILGTEMSPQEFLASPEAQDAVFKGKFMQKTSDPKDAASMWFTGRPLAQAQAAGAHDQLGTTASAYVGNFQRGLGLGAAPGSQAITAAMNGGTAPDGTPVMAIAGKTPAAAPGDNTSDTTDTGPRPLGPRPTLPDSPEIQGMIQRRNQLLSIMPQAKGTKYETMIPAAVQSLNDQISAARTQNATINKDPLEKANRAYDAENLLGFKRGSKEWKDYVAYGSRPPDKSSKTVNVKNPDGSETTMVQNDDGSFSPIPVPQTPRDPSLPAGVNQADYSKELAKEKAKMSVKNEQATLESKKSADKLIPHIDDAIEAYEKLIARNGIGPVSGSTPNRFAESAFNSQNEVNRQRYDLAIANLNLAQNVFKGQGAVSDFERRLMMSRFPSLQAAAGMGPAGLEQLKQMKKELMDASHDVYGNTRTFEDGTKIQEIK